MMETHINNHQKQKSLIANILCNIVVDSQRVKTDINFISGYTASKLVPEAISAVVFPRTQQEIINLISLANKDNIALYSRVPEGITPTKHGIIIDLSLMNRIVQIDQENLQAHIEPGVTFHQLQSAVEPMGLHIFYPAVTFIDSVLLTYVEREALFAAVRHSNKQVAVVHSVLADGRVYKSGSHALPNANVSHREDGGPNISKILFQSKNCFGIPTFGVVNLYPNFETRMICAWNFKNFKNALDAAHNIARREYCTECFIANRPKLAETTVENIDENQNIEWLVATAIEGGEELVSYYANESDEIVKSVSGTSLRENEKLVAVIAKIFRSVNFYLPLSISFYTTYDRINEFEKLINSKLPKNVNIDSVAQLYLPVKRASTYYVQYAFSTDTDVSVEIYNQIRSACLEKGAFFNNPSASFAKQVFEGTGKYYDLLKLWKHHIDKNDIMNTDQIL